MRLADHYRAAQAEAEAARARQEAERQQHAVAESRLADRARALEPVVGQFLRSMRAAGNPGLMRWPVRIGLRYPRYWTLYEGWSDPTGISSGEESVLIDTNGKYRSGDFREVGPARQHDVGRLLARLLVQHNVPLAND